MESRVGTCESTAGTAHATRTDRNTCKPEANFRTIFRLRRQKPSNRKRNAARARKEIATAGKSYRAVPNAIARVHGRENPSARTRAPRSKMEPTKPRDQSRNDCSDSPWMCIGQDRFAHRLKPAHTEAGASPRPILRGIELMLDQKRTRVPVASDAVAAGPGIYKWHGRREKKQQSNSATPGFSRWGVFADSTGITARARKLTASNSSRFGSRLQRRRPGGKRPVYRGIVLPQNGDDRKRRERQPGIHKPEERGQPI